MQVEGQASEKPGMKKDQYEQNKVRRGEKTGFGHENIILMRIRYKKGGIATKTQNLRDVLFLFNRPLRAQVALGTSKGSRASASSAFVRLNSYLFVTFVFLWPFSLSGSG
ncbi:MAG: hypothetical protein KDE50_35530 [Caldilineaceae bacterium]|nr:hypothetical protein [Caldilineaceae bacterium]